MTLHNFPPFLRLKTKHHLRWSDKQAFDTSLTSKSKDKVEACLLVIREIPVAVDEGRTGLPAGHMLHVVHREYVDGHDLNQHLRMTE